MHWVLSDLVVIVTVTARQSLQLHMGTSEHSQVVCSASQNVTLVDFILQCEMYTHTLVAIYYSSSSILYAVFANKHAYAQIEDRRSERNTVIPNFINLKP